MERLLIMKLFIALLLFIPFLSCSNSNPTDSNKVLIPKQDSIPQIVDAIEIDTVEQIVIQYSKNELMGKLKPQKDSLFVKIEKKYTNKSNIYLRKQAYDSYCKMYAVAKKEGLNLRIVSAFRSNYHQQLIWESKWTGKRKVGGKQLNISIPDECLRAKEILKYSSMPGSSRHHWGTDIDIYDLNNSTFESGLGLKIYEWLKKNAADYGFYQVYTSDRTIGYNEEKWHWSYLPIAKPMLNQFRNKISIDDFKGFKGSATAKHIGIIENYVLGINEECL